MADFNTPQARIQRMREWALSRSSMRSGPMVSPGSNLLLGAAMHGMARRSKGVRELSPIEKMAVSFVDAVAETEEERMAYGQIFSQAKSMARSGAFTAANVPLSVMSLPEEVPYDAEKFTQDAEMVGLDAIAQPHIRVVSLEEVGADGAIQSSPEYEAAAEQLNRGLTFFASREAQREFRGQSQTKTLPPKAYIRIKPTRFHCIRRSGELGKDEVYLTWGFGRDNQDKKSHRTPEFGSVVKGTTRNFPNDPPLFAGYTQKSISGHMVCWEADHSNSEWYNKLIALMREIATQSANMSAVTGNEAIDFLIGQLPGWSTVSEILFWLENIASLVAHFLDIFRNQDDKVMEHSFGWNRDLAEKWAKENKSVVLDFNGGGGGHHEVTVQFTKN